MHEQEQLRHQYLEALGITSWLPCTSLPGAPESADWVNDFRYPAPEIPFSSDRAASARAALSQTMASPAPAAPTKSSAASAQQGVSEARAALGLVPELNAPEAEPQKPVTTFPGAVVSDAAVDESAALETAETDSGEQREQPHFLLAFQRIGSTLVIDSLPTQSGSYGPNYQQLAAAIVATAAAQAKIDEAGELGQPFTLPWPMFASKTLDQSYPQALIAVQHKLDKEIKSAGITTVLLFGRAAAQMVLDRAEELDELKGIVFSVRAGVKAIASHSLTEAMQLPGIKKQIWLDLLALQKTTNAA